MVEAVGSRVARRDSTESRLIARLSRPSQRGLSGVVLHGLPGNGKRTLAMHRVSALFPGQVRIMTATDAETLAEVTENVVVFLDPDELPRLRPDAMVDRAHLVVVSDRLSALPGWMHAEMEEDPAAYGAIEVGELTLAELQHYLTTVVDAPVDLRASAEIGGASGSVPQAVSELVAAAIDAGVLAPVNGVWHLVGALEPALFQAQAFRLLSSLESVEREALFRLALTEPADFTTSDTGGRDSDRGDFIEGWLDRGILLADRGGRLVFRVPLLAEAVRLAAPRALVERVHFSELSPTAGVNLHAVTWALEHGRVIEPTVLLDAVERAGRRHDFRQVVVTATAWLAAGEHNAHDRREVQDMPARIRVLIARAAAWRSLGHGDEAEVDLDTAIRLCSQPDSAQPDSAQGAFSAARRVLLMEAIAQRAELLHGLRGDADGAFALLEGGWALATTDEQRAILTASRVLHLTYAGRHREALAVLERNADGWIGSLSDLLRARVQTLSCFSMCAVGAPVEALNAITSLRERNTLTNRGATALDEELQAAYHFCSLMANGPSASHAPFRHRDAIRAVEHAPDETGMALGV
ncbi:MAG: hypothetical protein ABI310_10665, partial [Microbacteriaceae bacterium]